MLARVQPAAIPLDIVQKKGDHGTDDQQVPDGEPSITRVLKKGGIRRED